MTSLIINFRKGGGGGGKQQQSPTNQIMICPVFASHKEILEGKKIKHFLLR